MILKLTGRLGLLATFAARIGTAAGGSLLAFAVAREGGPAILGQFALFTSLLGTIGIPARRGLDVILIRSVASANARGGTRQHVALLVNATRMCMLPTAGLSLVGAGLLGSGILGNSLPGSAVAFVLALPMLTALALTSGYLKGAGLPWIAPIFEIGGVSAIACLLILAMLAAGIRVTGAGILVAVVAAMVLACVIALALLRRDLTAPAATMGAAAAAGSRARDEWKGQFDFMLIALSTFMLQAGSFAIAAPFLSDAELGLVRAAERLAVIVSFPVLAINPFIAPRIVHHLVKAETGALRRTVRRAMLTGGLVAVLPLLAFVLAPTACLGLLGADFGEAAPYLQVMAIANFAIAVFGPSAMAMNMGGLERAAMVTNTAFLALGLLLFPLLTMLWGPAGFTATYAFIAVSRTAAIFLLARSLGERAGQ